MLPNTLTLDNYAADREALIELCISTPVRGVH